MRLQLPNPTHRLSVTQPAGLHNLIIPHHSSCPLASMGSFPALNPPPLLCVALAACAGSPHLLREGSFRTSCPQESEPGPLQSACVLYLLTVIVLISHLPMPVSIYPFLPLPQSLPLAPTQLKPAMGTLPGATPVQTPQSSRRINQYPNFKDKLSLGQNI